MRAHEFVTEQEISEVNWRRAMATGALAGAAALGGINSAQARVSPGPDGQMTPSFAQQIQQQDQEVRVIKKLPNDFEQIRYRGMNGVKDTTDGKIILIGKGADSFQIVTVANGKETTEYVGARSLGQETQEAIKTVISSLNQDNTQDLPSAEKANRNGTNITVTYDGRDYQAVMLDPNGPQPRLGPGTVKIKIPMSMLGIRSIGNYIGMISGDRIYIKQ